MQFDLKNILVGIIIGIFSTTTIFLLIGDVNIEADFQFGEKSDQENKDIRINIEKTIDKNNEEIYIVNATGHGDVTKKDIEEELGKVFAEQNIDASSGIEVNITLDKETNFE